MINVWKIAPGDNISTSSSLWPDCIKGSYIAIGWDNLGNLLHFSDKNSLKQALSSQNGNANPTNNAHSLWIFSREIHPGDVVIANDGKTKVRGIGIVTSSYIYPNHPQNPRNKLSYQNILKVKWLKTFDPSFSLSQNTRMFAIKTVANAQVRIDSEGKVIGETDARPRIVELPISIEEILKESAAAKNSARIATRYDKPININKNLILHGPPGTSKTHEALQLAAHILGLPPASANHRTPTNDPNRKAFINSQFPSSHNSANGSWEIVQFHSAYHYEDFVRGIRIKTSKPGSPPSYTTENGIFASMCAEAQKHPDKHYVLVIDEINRAHIAGVLGELIYGLEYRAVKISTPYKIDHGTNKIIVPNNIYIIGTMNMADRSIGHMDYAVRRRFVFIPVLPDESVLETFYDCQSLQKVALGLFKAVADLFKNSLSPDYHKDDVQVGHTYFLAESCDQLFSKFIHQVLPLLREYVKDGVLNSNTNLIINKVTFHLDGSQTHLEALDLIYQAINCQDCDSED